MVWNMYRYKNKKETGIELAKERRRIRPIKICFSSQHESRDTNEWYSRDLLKEELGNAARIYNRKWCPSSILL
jgi:hypothetical protein